MPRTKVTKSTKGEEGGGKRTVSIPAKRKGRAKASEVEGGRVRESRDFYRVPRGLTQPVKRREEGGKVEPEGQGAEVKPENRVAKAVIDTAFQIHTALGPGLLESVYEVVLAHELRTLGFKVERQVPIAIRYKDIRFEKAFVADFVVDGMVIVELKSVEELAPIHAKQLLTQLRLMQKRLGLLINFGSIHLKDNIRRLANGLDAPAKHPFPSL